MRRALFATIAAATVGVAIPTAATAGDGEIRANGSCSGASSAKIKVKPDDGRIEVEFEVDSNVNGQSWGVRLKRDGNVFFRGTRTTQAPSGSFSVERKIANSAGDDVIVGRATHGNQVCRGLVVFRR